MKDIVVVALVALAFASLVTTHIAIVYGLARRAPRWRALLALAFPPVAPYWAWRERMRARASIWTGVCALQLVALFLATRGA